MNKIFNKVLIAFAAGSISLSSCTDLDETLYSQLNETNIDLSNETDLSLLLGAATAQYRYLIEDWFGMFHLLEESADQYMVPARVGVGWGDAYINLHKHNWGPSVPPILLPRRVWLMPASSVRCSTITSSICSAMCLSRPLRT